VVYSGAMKTIRKLHFWIGVLFAPTIVFFALSGALQIAGLHEANDGEAPADWIAKLAEIHKEQSIEALPQRKPSVAKPDAPKPEPRPERSGPRRSLPLMLWFFSLALGLIVSTSLGLYMAFAYKRDRAVIVGLLVSGAVLPVVFAFL
jgi:hypothetical protein